MRLIPTLAAISLVAGAAEGQNSVNPFLPDIRFETSVSPVGNLFYQLECLGHRVQCSHSSYLSLWERIGQYDGADAEAVRRFNDMLNAYGYAVNLGDRSPGERQAFNIFGTEIVDIGPLPTESFQLLHRLRMAAYSSADRAQLVERLGLFMHPSDAAVLISSFDRFWPEFRTWWNNEASAPINTFAADLGGTLQDLNATTLPALIAFYHLEPPAGGISLTVHLIAHPEERSSTNAEVVNSQAIVEVLAGESPDRRIGVIVHELAHYLFKIAPKAVHDRRLEGALNAASPRSAATLGLMNETLATAIGNGYVEERLLGDDFPAYRDRPLSFYGRAEIDTAAKAIYPLMRDYLTENRPLDDAFVTEYYDRVSAAVGDALDSVESRLRVSAYIATDETLSQAMIQTPRILGMTSLYGSTLSRGDTVVDSVLHRHYYLNGVVLLRERERASAENLLPEAYGRVPLLQSGDVAACVLSRDSGAHVYFVVLPVMTESATAIVEQLRDAVSCE